MMLLEAPNQGNGAAMFSANFSLCVTPWYRDSTTAVDRLIWVGIHSGRMALQKARESCLNTELQIKQLVNVCVLDYASGHLIGVFQHLAHLFVHGFLERLAKVHAAQFKNSSGFSSSRAPMP